MSLVYSSLNPNFEVLSQTHPIQVGLSSNAPLIAGDYEVVFKVIDDADSTLVGYTTETITIDQGNYPKISIVIGSDTTGEAFYTANSSVAITNGTFFNGTNELTSTKNWDSYSASSTASGSLKVTIDGVETAYGTANFANNSGGANHNAGKSTDTGTFPNHYFVALGYELHVSTGLLQSIKIPISAFNGNSFPSYPFSETLSIYSEEITNGLDISTLTAKQTGTLSVSASDEGNYVSVTLSPALDVSNYI